MITIRKVLLSLACVLALGAGSSLAQNDLYAGASTGIDLFVGDAYFNFNTYLGFEDLISEGVDVRANLGIIAIGDLLVKLGGDALFAFQFDEGSPITIFAGGGPRLVFGSATDVGIGVVGNFDYALQPDISLFGEFDLDLYFASGITNNTTFAPGIDVGVRFKF